MSFNTQSTKQSSPINKGHSIEELKMKYESSVTYETPKIAAKTKSPKKLRKSKVKQMASMFNSKISQIIKRDNAIGKYSTLINEFSPEPKPQPTAVFVKPIPKPRTRYNKPKAPVPTPRMKSLAKEERSVCVVDKDILTTMTVKAKAQLFTQDEIVVNENQSSQSEIDGKKPKSAIDNLVEEAIPKLETIEAEQNVELPKPMPRKKKSLTTQTKSTTSAKLSLDEDSESGLSSLPKTSSEESLTTKIETSENNYEFVKPIKPLRKKKLRKNNTSKKDVTPKECNQLTSTDSEADCKETGMNSKPHSIPVKQTNTEKLKQSLIRDESVHTLTEEFAQRNQNLQQTANCSMTDQGFETATNDVDSPLHSPLSSTKNNFEFSTPIKNQEHHSFANTCSAKQQLFSPISKPLTNRRKSIYDIESGRNSLAMHVIKEDQTYEPRESFKTTNTFNQTQPSFANATTRQVCEEATTEKFSQFWIKCGDFSLALEINFTDSERLRLLYEIFSQTSCDTKDLHFGIDDQKFSVHGPCDMINPSSRIPISKGCSHYWFSTGDLAIPFSGKYLSSHKIQRIFRVIKETVEETGILRFGVDDIEFSNVPEFWYQPAKFSVESQYSILVGLQSGNSNGLEGRSKYAWPHRRPVMISDLDESQNESFYFEEVERGRLSLSPFGNDYTDLNSLHQEELSGQEIMSLESYCNTYESEPLEQLFEDSFVQNSQPERQQTTDVPIADMVNSAQQRLSCVQEHLNNYVNYSFMTKDSLEALKGTPEYVQKLKTIVTEIGNIGSDNNFKECTSEELESYMHFLSRYAELCLSSCDKHMDTVLDALADYRAVVV